MGIVATKKRVIALHRLEAVSDPGVSRKQIGIFPGNPEGGFLFFEKCGHGGIRENKGPADEGVVFGVVPAQVKTEQED